jgi:xanthine dehydrogenase molybdopterin-binding subunit B
LKTIRIRKKRCKIRTRIHDYGEQGNIHRIQSYEFGDVDEALAKSDHVFDDLFFYEGNTHLPIEQHASVAAPDGEGKLTLWSSTQVPHYIHRARARAADAGGAHPRHRLPERRRLRRQVRPAQPRDRGVARGAEARDGL